MSEQCAAKIKPFLDKTILQCEYHAQVPHEEHFSVLKDYAYPGSETRITWMETDRRTFYGDWEACPENCILPISHRGVCAP